MDKNKSDERKIKETLLKLYRISRNGLYLDAYNFVDGRIIDFQPTYMNILNFRFTEIGEKLDEHLINEIERLA